jgi:hypothetical protein
MDKIEMRFLWIIRTWCNLDSFWETVRSSKEYDLAFNKPEQVLEEIQKIVLKEQEEWKDLCSSSDMNEADRQFVVELPTVDTITSRPFHKFLSLISIPTAKEQFTQNWYIERLKSN